MDLKKEILLGIWVVVGIFSIYIGAMTLKFPDAAWERAEEAAKRRGKVARRTARWERSRIYNGALTICIGALLLGLSGWVALEQHSDTTATTPMYYIDPVTGKNVSRNLTPEEAKQFHNDPNGFMNHIAPELPRKN